MRWRSGGRRLRWAEKLGRDEMRAHVLNNIGVARMGLGDPAGLDDLEASREIARKVGGPEYLRACGNLASTLLCEGHLQRAAELHREALEIAQDIGYEEPTRWLSTEIASDYMLAGDWKEARRIVEELIPGYDESPFWVEPQTRVCRARMLIAEGAVEAAVADADRAVALVEGKSTFQNLCGPYAFRARLHAELGEAKDAARVVVELLEMWTETRSAYVESWVLDAWFAAWSTGQEAGLTRAIGESPISVQWLDVLSAFIERDSDKAVAQLESMAATSPAALARLWAGEWLVEQGRHADAAAQLERALPFWRSVGAWRYLHRCEALLAAAS